MRLALPISAALFALACEGLIGADFDKARPRAACDHAVPPGPPNVQNASGDVTLTAVITTVDYGEKSGTGAWANIGWDLDQRCTNQGDPPECTPEPWTGGDPTDGPRGQDNAIGKILSGQKDVFGTEAITSASESDLMKTGKRAPFALIRISGYTGFSEDSQVRVEWYSAVPYETAYPGETPKLDGTDAWPVGLFDENLADAGAGDGGALPEGGASLPPTVVVDDAAYVTQSTLVARFPKVRVPLASVFFEVENVVLSGPIEPEPATSSRRLKRGTIGGISPTDQMLDVVPRITFSVFSLPLCTDDDNYLLVRKFVCSGADIPIGPVPASKVCNGATFGITFETHPAEIGPTVVVVEPKFLCDPGKDPIDDSCAIPNP